MPGGCSTSAAASARKAWAYLLTDDDIARALAEMHRLTRPGGIANVTLRLLERAARRPNDEAVGRSPGRRQALRPVPDLGLAEAAGFGAVERRDDAFFQPVLVGARREEPA